MANPDPCGVPDNLPPVDLDLELEGDGDDADPVR